MMAAVHFILLLAAAQAFQLPRPSDLVSSAVPEASLVQAPNLHGDFPDLSKVAGRVSGAVGNVAEKVGNVVDTVNDTARQAAAKVTDMVGDVVDFANSTAQAIAAAVNGTANGTEPQGVNSSKFQDGGFIASTMTSAEGAAGDAARIAQGAHQSAKAYKAAKNTSAVSSGSALEAARVISEKVNDTIQASRLTEQAVLDKVNGVATNVSVRDSARRSHTAAEEAEAAAAAAGGYRSAQKAADAAAIAAAGDGLQKAEAIAERLNMTIELSKAAARALEDKVAVISPSHSREAKSAAPRPWVPAALAAVLAASTAVAAAVPAA